MAQVSASRPRPYSSYLIHERPETFAEADVEIRYEVSYLEHAGASAAVICGRGNSNSSWVKVSSRLKTAARLGARLSRTLSVRMFYKLTATGGLLSISSLVVSSDSEADLPPVQSLFDLHSPAITPVPCHHIRTRDERDWEYALCIMTT